MQNLASLRQKRKCGLARRRHFLISDTSPPPQDKTKKKPVNADAGAEFLVAIIYEKPGGGLGSFSVISEHADYENSQDR